MFFFLCKDSLILKNAGLMEGLHDVFLQILKLFFANFENKYMFL